MKPKVIGKRRICALFVLMLLFVIPMHTWAGTLYQYEDDSRFWWYISDENPAFEILVPSNTTGDLYPMYVHRNQFGETGLDIYLNEKGSYLSVGYMKANSPRAVRNNMIARYDHLFTNVTVNNDRMITNSLDVRGEFYSHVGNTLSGERGMFRSLVFQKDDFIVYLTFLLQEDEYKDYMREIWLRAVNSFQWTK